MDVPVSIYFLNASFSWFIVLLAIVGYFLTLRRMGERWIFWIVLASGWALFAIANTLITAGASMNLPFMILVWLSSYLLVVASLVILFIRLTKLKQ